MSELAIRAIRIEVSEQSRPGEVRPIEIRSTWSDGTVNTYTAFSSIADWTKNEIVKHLEAAIRAIKDAKAE